MDGIFALDDQREDAVEPAFTERNLESCPGSKAERADSGDVGQQNVFKGRIVRNV